MGLDGENNTALTHRITACPCRTHASAQTDRHTHIGEGDGSGQTAEGLVAQGAYDSCADEYVCNTIRIHTHVCVRVCVQVFMHTCIYTHFQMEIGFMTAGSARENSSLTRTRYTCARHGTSHPRTSTQNTRATKPPTHPRCMHIP
jgi:hypothetical protein